MKTIIFLVVGIGAVGVASAALTNRVKLTTVESTKISNIGVAPLVEIQKISPIIMEEIKSLVSADRLPSSVVQEIVALVSADRLPSSVVQEIVTLLAVEKLTEQNLVDIAMLFESKKLDLSVLKNFVALLKIENQSRFNALSPSMFSTLWVIKMKGLKAERNNENTDDLWKKYWDVFMRAED